LSISRRCNMKLILSVIQDADYDNVSSTLISEGFRVTCIASTGAFWKRGNKTLLIGLEEEKVDQALKIFREKCTESIEDSSPSHRATIFVLNVVDYVHF
jgi:uncharacterized protein YaaQ